MDVFGHEITVLDVPLFLTLVLLEGVLSFDNAAILAALVRKLPVEQRRKALLYGLGGAYAFRVAAILLVSVIVANPWLKIVGGAYLLYLALRHLVFARPHEEHGGVGFFSRFGLSGFWGVVVTVELADIAFALDQVLVAVAMTPKIPVIVAAALFAILFLRISAAYLSRVMDWFPQLESLAYAAVGFVGVKLIVLEAAAQAGVHHPALEALEEWSFAVTLALLLGPVLVKLVVDRLRRGSASG